MNRLGKLLALSALGAISLGTTLEAQNTDPVGVYGITINVDFDGQVMQMFGTLTIENSDMDSGDRSIQTWELPRYPVSWLKVQR